MSSTTLDLYWGLSSLDPETRLDSAAQLISALVKFQESHPVQGKQMATTEEELASLCASDVAYALGRLIKGLASPRDGARQGFSMALAELLARIPCISVKLVLSMLWKHTEATNSMKGQEQRDMRFGRIFGLLAVVQSGIIGRREGTTAVEMRKMVMELAAIGAKKSYLREVAYVTLAAMVPTLGLFPFRKELIAMFVSVALSEGAIETPDELLLALRLRSTYQKYDWAGALPQWHGRHLLFARNSKRLVSILCETSTEKPELFSSWHPQLHSVWDEVFSVYFSGGPGAEPPMGAMDFGALWERVVDGGLFVANASQFRRYWGFLLLERALRHVGEDAVAALMTPNVVRALMEQVLSESGKGGRSPLRKVAQAAAERLVAVCEGSAKVGLAVLTQLLAQQKPQTGPGQATLLGQLTERIVATLDSDAILRYVRDLQKAFVVPGEAVQGARAVEKHRVWAVEQMVRVARAVQLPVTDELTADVVRFVAAHGALQRTTTVGGGSCGVAALDGEKPAPALSQVTRDHCCAALITFVGDMSRLSTQSRADAKSDSAAGSGRLAVGCSRAGVVWSTLALQTVAEGARRKKVGLVLHASDEAQALLDEAVPALQRMAERTHALAQAGEVEAAQRVRGLELLLGAAGVLAAFSSDARVRAEYGEVVPELCECFARLDGGAAAAEGEPQPVEVLTEILISFQAKESHMMRRLCEQVFVPFTPLVTEAALDAIIGVLRAQEGGGGGEADDDDDAVAVETHMEDSDAEADGDEAADEDEDANVVDEELRRKIQEALGGGGDGDAAESSSDEEEFDDEQMLVFDDKLNEIFAHKKEHKRAVREMKVSFVNFKLRVLDLAETFLARQPASPLVLRLLPALLELVRATHRDSRNKPVHERAMAIVAGRRSAVPRGFDVSDALALQTLVHERARRAADRRALHMFGGVAAMLARVLAERGEAASVYAAYAASLDDFMTRKASQLFSDFFTAAAARLPPAHLPPLWRVAGDALSKYAWPGAAVNVFRQVQAFLLAAGVAREAARLQAPEDAAALAEPTAAMLRAMQAAVAATVGAAVDAQAAGAKPAVDVQRLREMLLTAERLVTYLARNAALADVARATLAASAEWSAAFAALAAAPPPLGTAALHGLCRTLGDVDALLTRATEGVSRKAKRTAKAAE
ncbi:DNA-directed DNA polymerase [Coemansia interrupta]|uniref:DNA-directed DNA polymerase n=1 Tax=Coemansia interrupta TaxID=1126814 RepID=A0A9W8LJ59_9FUNG|nr:DNA-directed DNA polymerase [Coemansia interrupta]